MSCDISRTFQTLIRAIQTTDEVNRSINPRIQSDKSSNAFSFWNRAFSLRTNLQVLADYAKRVHQLTATSVGNTFKQRVHAELTDQVAALVNQCTELLIQLNEISRLDDAGQPLKSDRQQLCQHRQVIYETLEEELNKLKRLRDAELDRQRHLMELTGSLGSGVRSIPSSRIRFDKLKSTTNSRSDDRNSPDQHVLANTTDVRNRKRPTASLVQPESTVVAEPELTSAEIQAFELENRMLYDFLNEQKEDITQVARAITEIGRLNQTLSAHLTDQLEATQQISSTLTHATEDVNQGNEQLRAALSNKASMQFWILFVLSVLTFSLHFLDWYYP